MMTALGANDPGWANHFAQIIQQMFADPSMGQAIAQQGYSEQVPWITKANLQGALQNPGSVDPQLARMLYEMSIRGVNSMGQGPRPFGSRDEMGSVNAWMADIYGNAAGRSGVPPVQGPFGRPSPVAPGPVTPPPAPAPAPAPAPTPAPAPAPPSGGGRVPAPAGGGKSGQAGGRGEVRPFGDAGMYTPLRALPFQQR